MSPIFPAFFDIRVGIEAVDHIVLRCILRSHLRQVRSGSTADDENIDLIRHRIQILCPVCLGPRTDTDLRRITSRKYTDQLHIFIFFYCILHTATEISIAENTYFHLFLRSEFLIQLIIQKLFVIKTIQFIIDIIQKLFVSRILKIIIF